MRNRRAGTFAARQGDAAHTRIVDDPPYLVDCREDVRVDASRCASLFKQPGERKSRLRHTFSVLQQQDVARHQLGARNARDLIIREVPRLNSEQHADGFDANLRARYVRDRLRPQIPLGAARIVIEDACGKHDLYLRFHDALAHLQRDDLRKFIGFFAQNRPRLGDYARAVSHRTLAPVNLEGVVRGGQHLF